MLVVQPPSGEYLHSAGVHAAGHRGLGLPKQAGEIPPKRKTLLTPPAAQASCLSSCCYPRQLQRTANRLFFLSYPSTLRRPRVQYAPLGEEKSKYAHAQLDIHETASLVRTLSPRVSPSLTSCESTISSTGSQSFSWGPLGDSPDCF